VPTAALRAALLRSDDLSITLLLPPHDAPGAYRGRPRKARRERAGGGSQAAAAHLGPGFGRRVRRDELIARWQAAVSGNLIVVGAGTSGRRMLLRAFEPSPGLPNGLPVHQERAANRSCTRAGADVVRLCNEERRRREWPRRRYRRFPGYGAGERPNTPGPAGGRTADRDPGLGAEAAGGISAEMAQNIASPGVRVLGDIVNRGGGGAGRDPAAPDLRLLPAGAGALRDAGLRAAEILRDVGARTVTRARARRPGRAARRALRVRR
jgi:hypothetical protein